ncbi:MAG TPA: hypothetical protein VFT76_02055 [Actinomycetota bacterium]|nr:hypothetical protein [Actinomycetota bacterium]
MMTRKDYRVVAAAIREIVEVYDPDELGGIRQVAEAIADGLRANSPLDRNGNRSFDPERFLREAGVR